jgi:hypothetical protein
MKTTRYLLVFFTLLLSIITVQAKSNVLLRLNLVKGTVYEMTMISDNLIDQDMMGQKMKLEQKMEMVLIYQVLDVLPNQNFKIEHSVQSMKMIMNVNGQEIILDSGSTDESNQMNKPLKDLVNVKVQFEMTPRGSVEKIEGLEQFAKELSGNPQMAQSMQMFLNDDNFGNFVGQTFNYFPEEAIEEGKIWTSSFKLPAAMNMDIMMEYEAAAIEKESVLLNVNSDVDMDTPIEQNGMKIDMKMIGNMSGTMKINPQDGWVTGSELDQKFNMNMKMKNPQNGEDLEIPMSVNGKTTITVVKK